MLKVEDCLFGHILGQLRSLYLVSSLFSSIGKLYPRMTVSNDCVFWTRLEPVQSLLQENYQWHCNYRRLSHASRPFL